MYADQNLNPVPDTAPFVSSNGTKYPGTYPKDEISELHKVTLAEYPSDSSLVVTGFHIDSSYNQVWDTRAKTAEELAFDTQNLLDSFLAAVKTALLDNDVVATRCVKAQIAYPAEWLAYDLALRALLTATEPTDLPSPPLDESGNVAYPSGS